MEKNLKTNNENITSEKKLENIVEEVIESKEDKEIREFREIFEKARREQKRKELEKFFEKTSHPKNIKNILDEHIIGQENAKKVVSQAIFNHIQIKEFNLRLPEQHLMLIGPSGSGKTEIFRVLKEEILSHSCMNIHIFDTSALSFSGYSAAGGKHLSDYLEQVNNGDIVVFDEFDKILLKNLPSRKDGSLLQSEFLKLLEGEKIIDKNISKCLFVFTGAFQFFEKTNKNLIKNIGFIDKENIRFIEESKNIDNIEFLKEAGIMNELLGRLTYIERLQQLNSSDFIRIIKNPNSIYSIYKKEYERKYNLIIDFKDDFLNELIESSIKNNLGVRGLNSKIIYFFNNALYSLDNLEYHSEQKKIILSKEFVNAL